jgi:hypothetical protein
MFELPLEVIRHLRTFLSFEDYMALVNTCHLFDFIKKQTMTYSLSFNRAKTSEILEVVRKCVEKVETPKNQISLCVRYPENDFFSSFRKIAKYLNTFHLGGRKVINLSLFNDIPVVILELDGVTRINNELQNIQSLSLSASEIRAYQESYSFRGFDEEFPVSQTGNMTLKKIPFRTDFNEQFQIIYAEKNNLRDLRCYFQAKDPSNFLNIVALELCGDLSFSRLNLSFIANIEHVRLYGDLEGQGGAVFPVFKGRSLLRFITLDGGERDFVHRKIDFKTLFVRNPF